MALCCCEGRQRGVLFSHALYIGFIVLFDVQAVVCSNNAL
jgi:hypothetical protein